MSDAAIICEGLGKQYRIGERERYKALRDVITDATTAPIRRIRNGPRPGNCASGEKPTVWVLKDVSFEIKRGEVVGIIGRNGAGKSTLLKILSRITEPTSGWARIHGRVGSLLEVGTGFHPELTGRENIFLNGAILGMKKAEIRQRFDDIVAFSEIEKFIDTPVKRYSSGMYVRLAFAVAVSLDTEILLVDEVLAVGDAQFQKKCLDRILQIGRGGRTILFVSHNMAAVRHICGKAVVLDHGGICLQGEVNDVVDMYLSDFDDRSDELESLETHTYRIDEIAVRSLAGPLIKTFDPVEIKVKLTAKEYVVGPALRVGILTIEGHRLAGLDFRDFDLVPPMHAGETLEMGFHLEQLPLMPGIYDLEVQVRHATEQNVELVPRNFRFEVVETPVYGVRGMETFVGNIGLRAQTFFSRGAIVSN